MNPSMDIGKLLDRIWAAATIYLTRPRSGVEDLHRDLELLRVKLEDVNRTINEAERNGKTVTEEARLWKSRAEAFVSKVAAIQQDYKAMQCLGGWSWNCVSVNQRVTKKLKEAQELISKVDFSRVVVPPSPPSPPSSQSSPSDDNGCCCFICCCCCCCF